MTLIPRHQTPDLDLPLAGGGRFRLSADHGPKGTMVVFYRGLHCPICIKQLKDLSEKYDAFMERGIVPLAVSSDVEERAVSLVEEVSAPFGVAYDMPLQAAREDWGLYVSTSRGKTSIGIEEPALFHEPGILLIQPDRNLYYVSIQSMPFARPSFADLLGAIDFAEKSNYPARGHYTGDLPGAESSAA